MPNPDHYWQRLNTFDVEKGPRAHIIRWCSHLLQLPATRPFQERRRRSENELIAEQMQVNDEVVVTSGQGAIADGMW